MRSKIKSPRCPECGKALYRTLRPKEKRQTTLYPYCRNESCRIHGDIRIAGYYPGNSGKEVVRLERKTSDKEDNGNVDISLAIKRRKRRVVYKKKNNIESNVVEVVTETKEDDEIAATRKKLSGIITNDKAKNITAMSVVVILQELGDVDIANMIIEKYNLDFDILKKKEGENGK